MSATEATVASKPLQIIECIDGVCTLNETNLNAVLKLAGVGGDDENHNMEVMLGQRIQYTMPQYYAQVNTIRTSFAALNLDSYR
jgi:hypothetical protein